MQEQGGHICVGSCKQRLNRVDSLSLKKECLMIICVLHHAFHNNTTPQIKFNELTLAGRGLNAACSEGVAVATHSLSRGEGNCRC